MPQPLEPAAFGQDIAQTGWTVLAAGVHSYAGTVHPQEVQEKYNFYYPRLIQYFEDITSEVIMLNTSFNLHGFPIACTPQHALTALDNSGLEHLALDSFRVSKTV